MVRYGWRCDVKYIGSGYSIGIAGGDNGVFRDFEDVGKDIVLLKIKILGQYSGIGILVLVQCRSRDSMNMML